MGLEKGHCDCNLLKGWGHWCAFMCMPLKGVFGRGAWPFQSNQEFKGQILFIGNLPNWLSPIYMLFLAAETCLGHSALLSK